MTERDEFLRKLAGLGTAQFDPVDVRIHRGGDDDAAVEAPPANRMRDALSGLFLQIAASAPEAARRENESRTARGEAEAGRAHEAAQLRTQLAAAAEAARQGREAEARSAAEERAQRAQLSAAELASREKIAGLEGDRANQQIEFDRETRGLETAAGLPAMEQEALRMIDDSVRDEQRFNPFEAESTIRAYLQAALRAGQDPVEAFESFQGRFGYGPRSQQVRSRMRTYAYKLARKDPPAPVPESRVKSAVVGSGPWPGAAGWGGM